MDKEEIERILSCEKCGLTECIGCEITYTDKKKIADYIQELEEREKEIKRRIRDTIDFAETGDGKKYYEREIKCLKNVLKLYDEKEG